MIKKIREAYGNMNIGVKVSIWFTFCNFFQKGMTMLAVPIFTRMMSTDEYGVYSVYQSWYQILTVIVTLNLSGGVYNNGLIKYEDDRNRFTSSMQGLSLTVAILFFSIYLLFKDMWTQLFELEPVYMIAMFLQFMFVPAFSFWSARQRFEYKYKLLLMITVIMSLSSPIIGIISVNRLSNKPVALVLSYATVQIIIGIVFFILNQKNGKRYFVKEYWRYGLNFNLPLVPHYLSQIVLGQSDRIMISRMVGSGTAAIYSVAYNISLIMNLFTNAINYAFIPSLYSNLKKKDYAKVRMECTYVIGIAAALNFVAMLLGPDLIKIFAPPSYYEAKWIMPLVTTSVFFGNVYALFINIEFYYEKTKYVMYVSILGAALNVLLNYIFIQQYGYIAAGYTTLFCYLLFSIGHYLLFKHINCKYQNGEIDVNSKFILYVSLVMLALTAISLLLYSNDILRYAIIGLLCIIALVNYKKIAAILKQVIFKKD